MKTVDVYNFLFRFPQDKNVQNISNVNTLPRKKHLKCSFYFDFKREIF
jgi:hypothetical protein